MNIVNTVNRSKALKLYDIHGLCGLYDIHGIHGFQRTGGHQLINHLTENFMETQKTLAILRTLADGIDPATGEQFSAGSSYQHPDTVRALFSAIRTLESPVSPPAQRPPAQRSAPAKDATATPAKPGQENAGRPWSQEEDGHLGGSYDSGKSIEELAAIHKRSKWAIESRLARLGKIPEPPSRFPARNAGTAATA